MRPETTALERRMGRSARQQLARSPGRTRACLLSLLVAGCGSLANEPQGSSARTRSLRKPRSAAVLALPAQPGRGLAIKVVCASPAGARCSVATNVDGTHPQGQLLGNADAYRAVHAPRPGLPPTTAQAFSWVFDRPVDWTDLQPQTTGVFSSGLDSTGLFSGVVQNVAWTFSCYLAIPASGTKSFAVGSEDGYLLAVNDGSATQTSQFNGSRSFAYGDTLGLPMAVSFPAAGLYPIYLLFWTNTAPQGVELAWRDGNALILVPNASNKNANGYALIPSASLYAPDLRATLFVEDQTHPAGPVLAGDSLQWTSTVRNLGGVAASGAGFSVSTEAAKLQGLTLVSGGSACATTSNAGIDTLSCSLSTADPGTTQTVRFSAQVKTGLAAGTAIEVQGFVTGAATDPALIASVESTLGVSAGDPSDIFVLTDDPGATAGAALDTGNAPVVAAASLGNTDDDPASVTVGVELRLPAAPILDSPAQGAEIEGPL